MSSLRSQAGSLDYEGDHLQHESTLVHGYYQVSRYLDEPWDVRRLTVSLGPESYAYWVTRKQGRLLRHQQLRTLAPPASETFPLPVSAITALRAGTNSSTDSDDSHSSTPKSQNLIKDSDESQFAKFFDEPDSDSDVDEDAFENLNVAIINALAPDLRLAAGVIAHLYELPPHLRAFVHGFVKHQGDGDRGVDPGYGFGEEALISQPTLGTGVQESSKRKRRSAGDDELAKGDIKSGKSQTKRRLKSTGDDLKYACPFNIYDRRKYSVRHETGSTGRRYLSCMGPGWTDPRHLKEHFAKKHRMPQCQRCWQTFDLPEQLSYHRDKQKVRCEDRTHLINEKESITESEWAKIEKALAIPRSKKGKPVDVKTDRERWFEIWRILFPQESYPNLPVPTHPHYLDPETLTNPPPTRAETERMIEIFKAIWDKRAEDVEGTYQPSQQEVVRMIREAGSITDQSAQAHGNSALPAPFVPAQTEAFETERIYSQDHAVGSVRPLEYDQSIDGVNINGHLDDPNKPWEYDQTVESVRNDDLPLDGFGTAGPESYGMPYENFDWTTFDENNPEHAAILEYCMRGT